ncbi:MAG TPA: ribosome maturation factor RimP [Thermoanaerobaculia bacterium]|jgi:ribosome maturation factor RimP|nr:ribosome maturation factor RimP [Thermoanaerobaculia bacterium]
MSAAPSRLAEVIPELESVAAASGCELLAAELKGGVMRLILDKPEGGVTLADCEHVSRQASALLDVLDFGAGRYVLEVSSPGLDRQLYRPQDYDRFAGRLARVTMQDPETGRKKTVVARLEGLRRPVGTGGETAGAAKAADTADVEVVLVDDKSGERQAIPLKNVKLARLEIEL